MKEVLLDNGYDWKNRLVYWKDDIMYKITKSKQGKIQGVKVWVLTLKEY